MLSRLFRYLILVLALAATGMSAQGGLTTYTDRGKADFDTAMQVLNPYGTWSKIDGVWAYTPTDHLAPYTKGQWVYTEFGWLWKGDLPHSWVTEHYGYWKRSKDHVWSWYPGPYWLPEIVEIRQTTTHIGWRSAAVDKEGTYLEEPLDRYAKTDEWTFVTLEQFAGPITPEILAKPDVAKKQLEDSIDSRHTYVTYREIDRPGPHPADFVPFAKPHGMFAPITLEEQVAAQTAPKNEPKTPSALSTALPTSKTDTAAANAAYNARKVSYWITMSLPTFWTPVPSDAQPKELYLYRPDFYQDNDGIARRISLWLDPKSRAAAGMSLAEILGGGKPLTKPSTNAAASSGPATPAVPVTPTPVKKHDPFKSPFEEAFHGPKSAPVAPATPATPVPDAATNAADAPIPPPINTKGK